MSAEGRCPNCGALVAADARWCGQCYAPLGAEATRQAELVEEASRAGTLAPGAAPAVLAAGDGSGVDVAERDLAAPSVRRVGTELVWDCAECGAENPMDLSLCGRCGTPFAAALGREEEERTRRLDPRQALVRSLLLPGLGHFGLGRGADGLARLVLFLWALGLALMMLLAGGSGAVIAVGAIFALAALALWAVTATDAVRVANGSDDQILSPRILLAGTIGLTVLSIGAFLAAGTLPAT